MGEQELRDLLGKAANLKHRLFRTDAKLAADYLNGVALPGLHIGGGPRILDGWLNTDLNRAPGVMVMDATRPFPFPENTFAFVFSEHMIEHVDYAGGIAMLRESHRVMQRGGIIRIVTPDLAAIAALAQPEPGLRAQQYLDYCCRHFIGSGEPDTAAAVANAMFRSWGHTFIYDEGTLREALEAAGFVGVVRRRLGESDHFRLRGIENEGRYPDGLLDFESLALEAQKPGTAG